MNIYNYIKSISTILFTGLVLLSCVNNTSEKPASSNEAMQSRASKTPVTENINQDKQETIQKATNTFYGYFRYMADAAVFEDCKTSIKYGVLMTTEAYNKLETSYLDSVETAGEPLFIKVNCITQQNEGEGWPENITIHQFSFSNNQNCN